MAGVAHWLGGTGEEIGVSYDFKRTNNNLSIGGELVQSGYPVISQFILHDQFDLADPAGSLQVQSAVTLSPGGMLPQNTDRAFGPSGTAQSGTTVAKASYGGNADDCAEGAELVGGEWHGHLRHAGGAWGGKPAGLGRGGPGGWCSGAKPKRRTRHIEGHYERRELSGERDRADGRSGGELHAGGRWQRPGHADRLAQAAHLAGCERGQRGRHAACGRCGDAGRSGRRGCRHRAGERQPRRHGGGVDAGHPGRRLYRGGHAPGRQRGGKLRAGLAGQYARPADDHGGGGDFGDDRAGGPGGRPAPRPRQRASGSAAARELVGADTRDWRRRRLAAAAAVAGGQRDGGVSGLRGG